MTRNTRVRSGTLLALTLVFAAACSSDNTGAAGGPADAGAGDGSSAGSGGSGGAAGAGGAGGSGGASGSSGSGGASDADGAAGAAGSTGTNDSGPPPATTCTVPLTRVDTSAPDHVVGDGTSGSCIESALKSALVQGGKTTFHCGGPATITVTSQIDLPTDKDTVIDGGGTITLDGGGSTRILSLNHGDYRTNPHVLTLQGITLSQGKSSGTQIPAAPAPCSQGTDTDGGGSALFVRDAVVHIIDSTFSENTAPDTGPDVGGAVYVLGSTGVVVQGSSFRSNTGANGPALYMLQSDLQVTNTVFDGNRALGTGENYISMDCAVRGGESGNGGNAGAIAIDGADDGDDSFCGVVFKNNHANELGGAVGRTPDGDVRKTTFDKCTFDGNDANGGGSLYFHHSNLVITSSTFSNNKGKGAGAIQADDTNLDFTNVTFSGNDATNGLGGAISLFGNGGTLVNCTFADNTAGGGSGLFGAALAGGADLTIRNTIFANNTSQDCGAPMACADGDGSMGDGNLQWPQKKIVCANDDKLCTPSTTFADAKVGALADNGGPTLTRLPDAAGPAKGIGNGCPATDQRGQARPAMGCTAGAVEP